MEPTILVNKVKIEKSTINRLLIQNKKLEAVKFICDEAHIDLASSKNIIELFQDGTINQFDGKDLYHEATGTPDHEEKKAKTPKFNLGKFLWITGFVLIVGFLFLKYVVGFNQIGFHLTELKIWVLGSNNSGTTEEAEIAKGNADAGLSNTVVAQSVEDLYPVDTNRIIASIKEAEIQKIKNAHFEKLIVAKNPPSDEDTRVALINLTEGRLTDVIIHQKLNVKTGKCYENPNTDGNFRCVSCMILLYNRETKTWQEAPDGENFMKNAYDFYQPSDGDFWEAKDLSMMIPFDYNLFKKYKSQ